MGTFYFPYGGFIAVCKMKAGGALIQSDLINLPIVIGINFSQFHSVRVQFATRLQNILHLIFKLISPKTS